MTYHLYVKEHEQTGLKYLGMTGRNPDLYKGSGKYWLRYLKKHGGAVSTYVIGTFETKEELKEWGLFYSEAWGIVASEMWANLREETGNGIGSDAARKFNRERVANGTHNFFDGRVARRTQLKRIIDGVHPFVGGKFSKKNSEKSLADGTHVFLDREFQRKAQEATRRRVANGTHNLLDGEIGRKAQLKRVADGTHNFLGGANARKRFADGTHNFLDGEFQRLRQERNRKRIECPYCGKIGGAVAMIRWHFDKCREKICP